MRWKKEDETGQRGKRDRGEEWVVRVRGAVGEEGVGGGRGREMR